MDDLFPWIFFSNSFSVIFSCWYWLCPQCTILLPLSMMKGHEVKRASNGEPLVEFGLLLCVWNKKRFSGALGGLFSGPAVWIWFQVPYLIQVHFLLLPWNLCHIIVYRHLEGRTQTGLQETLKKGRLTHRRVSLISLHDQVPFKFKSRIMSTG